MTNGSVGTLYAGSSYSGATVVDLTSGYVEFQDASGAGHVLPWGWSATLS
jgi:hypothetical protein